MRMRRNSVNFASGLKSAVTIVFIDHDILERRQNFGDMLSGYKTFRHIFTAHAQKRLFRDDQKSVPDIRSGDIGFL